MPPLRTERIELDPVFLMYSFRYALGRMSYAVGEVARALIEHRDVLTPDWRQQIVQDIDVAVATGTAGMKGDIEKWQEVARVMSE